MKKLLYSITLLLLIPTNNAVSMQSVKKYMPSTDRFSGSLDFLKRSGKMGVVFFSGAVAYWGTSQAVVAANAMMNSHKSALKAYGDINMRFLEGGISACDKALNASLEFKSPRDLLKSPEYPRGL